MNDFKKEALQLALKNPKMAKLVMDAVKSPIGSSKREQARGVLNSLAAAQINKTQRNMIPVMITEPTKKGGQGGPANPVVLMPPTPSYPSVISLKPASMKPFNFQPPQLPTPPINVNPSRFTGQGGGLPQNITYKEPRSRFSNIWGAVKDTFRGLGTSAGEAFKDIGSGVKSFVGGTIGVPLAGVEGAIRYATDPTRPSLTRALGESAGQQIFTRAVSPTQTPQIPNVPNIISQAQAQTTPTVPETPSVSAPGASTQGIPSPTTPSVPYDFTGPLAPGQTYGPPLSSLAPGSLAAWLDEAVKGGIGPLAFSLGALDSPQRLQDMFPNVPFDQLPVGALLSKQLNDLKTSITKEAGLTEANNRLTQAITRGTTLPQDLTSYIRGKDEFLNSVDKMLRSATEQYLNSSMRSDPFYQKSMKQYTDYLTILKGRTTQRYIDYLNTAIGAHNAEVQQLQNDYNAKADMVNKAFEHQAAITTEQYGMIKDSLADMYNNAVRRSVLGGNITAEQAEILKQNADLEYSILRNKKIQLEIDEIASGSKYDRAREIAKINLDKSDDTLLTLIREETELPITDINAIIASIRQQFEEPITPEKVKQIVIEDMTPRKDTYSREEAKIQEVADLKADLGLGVNDSLPKKLEEAIDEALDEVYGTGGSWWQWWK